MLGQPLRWVGQADGHPVAVADLDVGVGRRDAGHLGEVLVGG